MKNLNSLKISVIAFLLGVSPMAFSQTLVHYWDFNNNTSVSTIVVPTKSLVANASLNTIAGGTSTIDAAGGTGQNFNVDNINSREGSVAGSHLRFNNPVGGALRFNLPTTGYKDIVLKTATRRSGSGAGTQKWSYSVDGSNFIAFSTFMPKDANPELLILDFSTISGTSNNPNFAVKVEFEVGGGGAVGNNRFDNFTMDANPAGGIDTTAPTVTHYPANNAINIAVNIQPTITFNEDVRLIDDSAITNSNAANLVELRSVDASGAAVPFTTTFANNQLKIIPSTAFSTNQKYYVALKPNAVEDFSNNAVSSVSAASFTTASTTVSFDKTFIKVNENAGTLNFALKISNPSDATVNLVVKPSPFSTADAGDFTFANQTITITPASSSVYNVSIPIIDDALEEQQAEYFVLSLENAVGATVSGESLATVYIIDNDKQAPVASNQISLNYVGSFDPSGENSSTTEIVVHDPVSKRLYTTSAIKGFLDIIDFTNPSAPTVYKSVDMKPYGGVTSVAVKNGVLAVASPNTDPQLDGSVVFFNTNGDFIKQVTVGALPDMVTFTHDGRKVLTANEGEPNASYSVDPEGSVSIIDISAGVANISQADVTTLYFTGYNAQEAQLLSAGIRKLKASSTLSQDLEPEYITVSEDNAKAFVTIQENNAVGEINLNTKTITSLWHLGKKDMNLPGNGFDASDNNGEVLIANWPVKSYYIPDGVATYKVNGTNYIVTANEGDEKEFTALNERTSVGANDYKLDPAVFPQAQMLKSSYNLGRFRVTNVNGNTDADTDYEEINSVGARSFSIFNADTKQIVFDSGDDFERYTAKNFASVFNADHSDANTPKTRSRSKGPEPEGVTLAKIADQTFAFISLERVGGVMVYNVTNPNAAVFVDYKNTRSTSAYGGDNGAEGITYIPKNESATGKGYILIANEISGTLTIYEINDAALSGVEVNTDAKTFSVFPNPAPKGTAYFNREADIELYDMTGKLLLKQKGAKTVDTSKLASGVYIIKTSEGIVKRMIVK